MDIPKDIIKCPWCGKEFERKQSAQKYCCAECRKKAGKHVMRQNQMRQYKSSKLFECGWCGLMFESKTKEEYCCEECRKKAENRKKKRAKKKTLSLEEVAVLSREAGLSYGEYVMKYRL